MSTPDTQQQWFITGRNLVMICLALFLCLGAGTLFLCVNKYQSATELSLKEDRTTANLLSLILEEHLAKVVKTMESYASRPLLVQAAKKKDAIRAHEHLANLVTTNPGIDSIIFTNEAATLWASYPLRPGAIGMNLTHREWYQVLRREWKPYISNAMTRLFGEKDLAVQVCVPVFEDQGKVIGILINTQRTVALARIIERVPLDPGCFCNVTDRKGNLIYSSRFAYDKELKPYPFFPVRNQIRNPRAQSVPVADPFLDGRTRYISYSPVAGCGWSVFISRDSRAILLGQARYYLQTTAIALLLFLTLTLALVYFRKQVLLKQFMARAQVERELQETKAILKEALDQSPVGIAIADAPDGALRYVNDAGLLIRGADRQTIVNGIGIEQYVASWQLLDLDGRPLKTDDVPLSRALRFGETCSREFIIRRADNDDRIVQANAAPIRNDHNEVVAGIVVFMDTTERRHAEEKLRQLNEELTSSNRDLEQFAYVASHDLQEPLRMVASFTQLLALRYQDQLDEKGRKFIEYAVDGATRMQRLIDDLLTYSRVGTRGGVMESTDTRAALDEALRNLHAGISENGAQVTISDLPTVRADPSQLVQLFQNLVGNALKFRRPDELPRINISAEYLGKEWRFTIQDNGIGIDPQYADKVFIIFQRLHTRKEYPGTGIGLAVCKRIVERHGGRIWMESTPGQGTTFFFTLAALPPTRPPPSPTRPDVGSPRSGEGRHDQAGIRGSQA